MKVLIADDSVSTRKLVEKILLRQGYEVVTAGDGDEAWDRLSTDPDLSLAILDWMMPGADGVEICGRIRELAPQRFIYALLLTSKGHRDDIVRGLDAGADDYVIKPF
ncbi:MAG: response regulator, partial [Myxococcales bacterium]|nr:response regulator [Myxococcales bacterium]